LHATNRDVEVSVTVVIQEVSCRVWSLALAPLHLHSDIKVSKIQISGSWHKTRLNSSPILQN